MSFKLRRILCFACVVSLLICFCAVSVSAKKIRANGFLMDDNTGYILEFTPALYNGGNDIIIPNSINGIKVCGVETFAFSYAFDDLAGDDYILTDEEAAKRKIYIPDGVTYFGEDAFYTGFFGPCVTVCCDENSSAYKYLNSGVGGFAWGVNLIKGTVPQHDLTNGVEVVNHSFGTYSVNEGKTISVLVNGNYVTFDQQPIIENSRTLVPLRAIFEALGASVGWNDATKTVSANRKGTSISLKIGSNQLIVNGVAKTIDVPARIVNDRTMVPARAVAEAFGCSVDWNDSTKTVIISE